MLCTPWTCFSGDPVGTGEGSPRCEPRTHFGCELVARFGPSSVHYTWLPKRMPVRAEPGPKSGPRFCLPSLRTSYRRGVRGLPDTLPQVRRERLFVLHQSGCHGGLTTPRRVPDFTSNGGLLCTWCKGSCRRSFVAPVPRQQPSAAYDWLSVPGLFQGSYCRIWQNSSVQLATRTMF